MSRIALPFVGAVAVCLACAAERAPVKPDATKGYPVKTINGKLEAILPDGGTLAQHRRWVRGLK